MIKEGKEYITSEKKAQLEAELNQCKTVRRKEIVENIEWAKSLGDLRENAEYAQAREDQAKNEARIDEIENILQNAIVTDGSDRNKNVVHIGSVVKIKKAGDNSEQVYTIVGTEEASVEEGKISNESPLGDALLGHEKGEEVIVSTPKGKISYTILKLE